MWTTPWCRDIIKLLDELQGRPLPTWHANWKLGGYDTATIANRMSGKAVAEFAEAEQADEATGRSVAQRGAEIGG